MRLRLLQDIPQSFSPRTIAKMDFSRNKDDEIHVNLEVIKEGRKVGERRGEERIAAPSRGYKMIRTSHTKP